MAESDEQLADVDSPTFAELVGADGTVIARGSAMLEEGEEGAWRGTLTVHGAFDAKGGASEGRGTLRLPDGRSAGVRWTSEKPTATVALVALDGTGPLRAA